MKFFYEGINKFMYKHPFIKSCVYFASKFCPWMVAIFYSLFLLKIVIESQTGFYLLFIKPFVVLLITVLLRILIDRPRPIQKYDLKPIDDKKRIGHSFPSIHTSLAISIALLFSPSLITSCLPFLIPFRSASFNALILSFRVFALIS